MTKIYLENEGWASPNTRQHSSAAKCDPDWWFIRRRHLYVFITGICLSRVISMYWWCVISLHQVNTEADSLFPPPPCDSLCYQIRYLSFPPIPVYWLNSFGRFINSMSSRPRVIRQISHMSRSALLNNSAAGICMEKSSLGAWCYRSARILLHIITADTAAHYTASGTEWVYS